MQSYKLKNGLEFYAATPNNADAEFCNHAHKFGFYLCGITPFSTLQQEYADNIQGHYFAHENMYNPIVKADGWLILPKTGSEGYLTCHSKMFDIFFQPAEESGTMPEEPMQKKLAGKSFYLDAGHGGEDPGACNDNFGLQEKIAALDICLKLGLLLEAQGAKVYYSRTDSNTRPALSARAAQANELNVDAFISIHLNSAANKDASGTETLVYSEKTPAYKLAELVQKNMIAATGWKNRGIKLRPELTVLAKTKMPAILVETGFISNDKEAQELFKPEIQEKIAKAICTGIVEFYN